MFYANVSVIIVYEEKSVDREPSLRSCLCSVRGDSSREFHGLTESPVQLYQGKEPRHAAVQSLATSRAVYQSERTAEARNNRAE